MKTEHESCTPYPLHSNTNHRYHYPYPDPFILPIKYCVQKTTVFQYQSRHDILINAGEVASKDM